MGVGVVGGMGGGMGVVNTESSGMTDLVEDSHDGLFVIPGETESLSAAIVRLCRDPELRERLGSAPPEKMKRYTLSESARRHEMGFYRAMGFNTDTVVLAKPKTSTAENVRVVS